MRQNEDHRILCLCLNVTAGDIRRAVELGARTFLEIQQHTHCSKSCGMCVNAIQKELECLLNRQ